MYSYAYLIYENLTKERNRTNPYEEGVIPVAAETFQNLANGLHEQTRDSGRIAKHVQIVVTLLCTLWYIRKTRYFSEDATMEIAEVNKPCQNNIAFSVGRPPSFSEELTTHGIISVQEPLSMALRIELP